MGALMSSLWPQLRLPGAVLFYWLPWMFSCWHPELIDKEKNFQVGVDRVF